MSNQLRKRIPEVPNQWISDTARAAGWPIQPVSPRLAVFCARGHLESAARLTLAPSVPAATTPVLLKGSRFGAHLARHAPPLGFSRLACRDESVPDVVPDQRHAGDRRRIARPNRRTCRTSPHPPRADFAFARRPYRHAARFRRERLRGKAR